MINNDQIIEKSKKVDQIIIDCSAKLNTIEKQQNEVVKDLGKKTDAVKIIKVKKEIEAL
ncbi:MAG: hypothetical protein NTY30_02015 [Candidatus Berkelbacteria bacterium]|nr:hypothetical protein [Candidatus Berkelbacteria bacterium]